MNSSETYPKVISQNPNFRELVLKKIEGQHFMKLLDIEMVEIEEGRTKVTLQVTQKHHQQYGFLHGGVISTLADVVMGFAAFTLVPSDHHVVTGDLRVSFLSPSTGGQVYAKGWVLKPGRKLHFCEGEIWERGEQKNKLIAKASSSMAVIFPEDFHRKK